MTVFSVNYTSPPIGVLLVHCLRIPMAFCHELSPHLWNVVNPQWSGRVLPPRFLTCRSIASKATLYPPRVLPTFVLTIRFVLIVRLALYAILLPSAPACLVHLAFPEPSQMRFSPQVGKTDICLVYTVFNKLSAHFSLSVYYPYYTTRAPSAQTRSARRPCANTPLRIQGKRSKASR